MALMGAKDVIGFSLKKHAEHKHGSIIKPKEEAANDEPLDVEEEASEEEVEQE